MAAMVGAQGDAPADLRMRFHVGWRAWVVKIKEMQVTAKFPLKVRKRGTPRNSDAVQVEAEAFLKEMDKLILQTSWMSG